MTLSTGATSAGAMLSMLSNVLIAVFYLVGGRQISKVLAKIDEKKGAAVWNVAKKISASALLYLVGAGLYITFTPPAYEFSFITSFGVSLLQISLNISCYLCLEYVKSGAKTIFKKRRRRRRSCPVKRKLPPWTVTQGTGAQN